MSARRQELTETAMLMSLFYSLGLEMVVWFQCSLHGRKWAKLNKMLTSCKIGRDLDTFL